MEDGSDRPPTDDESVLKARLFAAFDQACRQGDVEVADELLAIINAKWMRPGRAARPAAVAPGQARESAAFEAASR